MKAHIKTLFILLILPTSAFCLSFDDYWHDGQAELDAYRITISRYGQARQGRAMLIYVTEPFSESRRVKLDDPGKNPRDVVDVLKLNIVRDFQTGIYDYNTMVSVFVRSADLSPVKISFSSAEWCGHVFEELLFYPGKIAGHYDSYFEGESGTQNLAWPKDGITEDNLWILLRGLRGEFLKPGQKTTVPFLPSIYYGRLAHKPLAWTTAEISRDEDLYTVKIADGRTGKFWIEPEYPHRIKRWELTPDITAELTGSKRLKYWQLHNEGDESHLNDLGGR